jgi:hypothetical protein
MVSVAARHGEAREGLFVAALRPYHEIGIHRLFRTDVIGSDRSTSHGMGPEQCSGFNVPCTEQNAGGALPAGVQRG